MNAFLCPSVAIAGLLFLALAAPSCGSASPPERRVALVYGDSLLFEAQPTIEAAAGATPEWNVVVRSHPGFAPCDWFDELERDLRTLEPEVVVLETAGNSWTACMAADGGALLQMGTEPYFERYRADLARFFETVVRARVPMVFLRPIPVSSPLLQAVVDRLSAIAASQAEAVGSVSIDDRPRLAVSDRGAFALELPCRPDETAALGCTAGRVTLREPAGLHFCPAGYASAEAMMGGCPVSAPGARRFGLAVREVATESRLPRDP